MLLRILMGLGAAMMKPTRSFPRRPARPVICCNSDAVSDCQPIAGASIGDSDNDCARREIDASGDGGSGEDRVEQTCAHHLFDYQFPRRQMTGMMRRDAAADDRVPVTMVANLGILLDKAAHEIAALFAATHLPKSVGSGQLRMQLHRSAGELAGKRSPAANCKSPAPRAESRAAFPACEVS